MKKIVVLGAGGHASNIIDLLLNEQDEFHPVGVLDPVCRDDILGVPCLGDDSLLKELNEQGILYAFPGVGFGENTNNMARMRLFNKVKACGYIIPNLISNKAFIRSGVKMGEGNLIQAGSVIDTFVEVADNVAIGFNTLVGHHSVVSSHVTMSGHVTLNGGSVIGEGAFLGMGAIVYRNVGDWSKVAPGCACLQEVPSGQVAFGNPVKLIPNMQIRTV